MESAIAHVLDSGEQRTSDVAAGSTTFEELHLDRNILKGLQSHKFLTPTKIQAAAIPMAFAGMDLLVQSKSGTGKTLIYVLAALQLLDKNLAKPQVLIIVPTRELAIQVEDTANGLTQTMRHRNAYETVSYIGGTDIKKDRLRMAKGRIVVGTPGRLLHLIHNQVFNTSAIKLLVLDEADQLYATPSLQKDVQTLLDSLLPKCQIIACSATYPNELDERLAKIMNKPILVSNSERATVLLGVRQFVYELPEQLNSMQEMMAKLGALRKIFDQLHYEQGILFASSQSRADSFRNYLQRNGVECDLMSGAMKQSDRLETFQSYRNFKTRTMVATDLMARGVDSSHANLVINLDPPKDLVTYLHRIGRAGRFGSKGIAITFISSPQQCQNFKRIITEAGTGMSVLQFPGEQRVGFNFWDFESYDFPYFQKMEAHEQKDDELKRIKQRWKGKSEQTSQTTKYPIKHLENEIAQNSADHLQQGENSVEQETNRNDEIKPTQVSDNKTIESTHQSAHFDDVKEEIQPDNEVKGAKKTVETEPQRPAELKYEVNSIQQKPFDQEYQQQNVNDNNDNDVYQEILQDNCDKIKASLFEPMELTPSTDIPAAAPNSINTKTYCLMAPTDRSSTTLLPLGISNTVDDASSIVSDSMENDYDSDTSYSSFYSISDGRLIWRRALSQKKLQKRRQRAKRRICLLNLRRCNLSYWPVPKVLRKPIKPNKRMINNGTEGEEDPDVSTLTEWQNKKYEQQENEENSKQRESQFDFNVNDRLLLISKRFKCVRLLKKFDNLSEMQRHLNAYFEKSNMTPKKFDQWMDQLFNAMQHLYYVDHSKPKALHKRILPEISNLDNYNKLMKFLNLQPSTYVLPQEIKREQPKEKPVDKLTVHVNQQVNIMPIIAVDESDNAEHTHSETSGSDSYSDNESEGADSVEPYSSSGFVESTESASSGIETSQYGSNSSTELESDDNEEEEEEEASEEEDDNESESTEYSEGWSLTLTAETDDYDTDKENDIEEDDTDDDTAPDAANDDLALAQARWRNLFEHQYQFIASYVDNYMATYRHQY